MTYFHIAAILICVVAQIIAGQAYVRLKNIQTDRAKKTFYTIVLLLQIVSAAAVIAAIPIHELWYFNEPVERFPGSQVIVFCILGYLIVTYLLPIILLTVGYQPFIDTVRQNIMKQSFLYPIHSKERLYYTIVVISIGISEEVVYRSFFVHYFHRLPADFSWQICFILAVILFALLHYHQRLSGMWNALLIGVLFSYLFIATGSLLLPIILHIVYDLKIVLVTYLVTKNNT